MRKLLLFSALLFYSLLAIGQSAIIRGEESAGVYSNLKAVSGVLQVIPPVTASDPCLNPGIPKSSVPINISTATTVALVAPSGTTTVYACNFGMTISQVVTTANTIKFIRGTGATCGTGTADLTGAFGTGGITAGIPIVVLSGGGTGTQFKGNANDGICAVTTIGATAAFVGVFTYVQQ